MGVVIVNLLAETIEVLNSHGLKITDVKVIFNDNVLKDESEIRNALDCDYNDGWGTVHFKNIQLVIDDYTWFERTSYDGSEKYVLKAHPILSNYTNSESHPGS